MKGKAVVPRVGQAGLFIGIGLIYVLLIVLSILLMNHDTVQLVTNYLTNNPLASQVNTVFAPASHVLWNIQIRWVVTLILGISVARILYRVISFSLKAKKKSSTEKIDGFAHKLSYVDRIVTGTLVLLVIANLNGLQDIMTLILVAGLSALGYKLGRVAFRAHKDGNQELASKAAKLSCIAKVLPWVLILVYVIGTWTYGGVRSPWYVYALDVLGIVALGVSFLFRKKKLAAKASSKSKDTPKPIGLLLFEPLTKVAFTVILIIGLR